MKMLTLLTVLFTSSLIADVLPLHVEEIDFAYTELRQCVATLTLSNKTVWKRPCIFSDEAVLGQWAVGDEVILSTDDYEGIRLDNLHRDSHVYALLDEASLVKPLQIADIALEVQRRGFFRRAESTLRVTMSDKSVWEVYYVYQFSNRWSVGQPVLLSRSSDGYDKMINVLLPWDPRYEDDRSVDVQIVEETSPLP